MKIRPSIVLYGYCHVNSLHRLLQQVPTISDRFVLQSFTNYADPATGRVQQPSAEVLESCEYFFYQTLPSAPIPKTLQAIRLPALCCDLLSPSVFQSAPDPRYPQYPLGPYPYGDRILARLAQSDLEDEEVVDRYLRLDFNEFFDKKELVRKWMLLIERLDSKADIKAGDFLLSEWRRKRLFWDSIHPANQLFLHILEKMVAVLGLGGIPAELDISRFADEDDGLAKPVHRSWAKALNLRWYSRRQLYKHLHETPCSEREWASRYVQYVRSLDPVVAKLPHPPASMREVFWDGVAAN